MTLNPGSGLLDDPRVLQVLDRAPVLYSVVDTGRGLHATPTAFSWSGGALWFVAVRDSVKLRAIRRRPRIGLLLRSRRYDLVATGSARLVDPVRGRGVADIDRLLDLPFFAASYFSGNSKHVAGILRDADLGPGLVLDRTAVRVRPQRVALMRGNEVLASWGDWNSSGLTDHVAPRPSTKIDDATLPVRARALLHEAGPGCLAWPSTHGPTALPAWWTGNGGMVETSAELMTLIGGNASGAAALAISTGGYRLATKRGIMMRGEGHVGIDRSGRALIGLDTQRITFWQGGESATVPVYPDPAPTVNHLPTRGGR